MTEAQPYHNDATHAAENGAGKVIEGDSSTLQGNHALMDNATHDMSFACDKREVVTTGRESIA